MSTLSLVPLYRGLLPVLLLALLPAGARSTPADPGQADIEQLEQRVNAYFRALHARQLEKAREFVLPRSRDTFGESAPGKARVTGLKIVAVELEEGGDSAIVTTRRTAMAGGIGPVRFTEKFRWKREQGEWFLDPDDPPKTDSQIFTEYYYKKQGRDTTAEFEGRVFDFGLAVQGDPVQPRFSFRNPSSQDLVVKKVHAPGRLFTDRTEKRLVPAGASGEIAVELNTTRLHRDFVHDIFVQFEPVKEMVKLRIKGKVYTAEEIAGSPSLSKEAAAKESAAPANP